MYTFSSVHILSGRKCPEDRVKEWEDERKQRFLKNQAREKEGKEEEEALARAPLLPPPPAGGNNPGMQNQQMFFSI